MVRRAKNDLAEDEARVYPAALRYLSRRDYARQELAMALLRRGAAPAAVEAALLRLSQQGYLNDQRFAAGRVRHRRDYSGRGRLLIQAELQQLGVEAEVAAAALDQELDAETEAQQLQRLTRRALEEISALPLEQRRKKLQALQRRLLNRGFAPALVFEAVSLAGDLEADDTDATGDEAGGKDHPWL